MSTLGDNDNRLPLAESTVLTGSISKVRNDQYGRLHS